MITMLARMAARRKAKGHRPREWLSTDWRKWRCLLIIQRLTLPAQGGGKDQTRPKP